MNRGSGIARLAVAAAEAGQQRTLVLGHRPSSPSQCCETGISADAHTPLAIAIGSGALQRPWEGRKAVGPTDRSVMNGLCRAKLLGNSVAAEKLCAHLMHASCGSGKHVGMHISRTRRGQTSVGVHACLTDVVRS